MSKNQALSKLGSLIKEARVQRGWSQDELAYESRVSVAHIKNIEDAKRSELPEEAYLLGFISKILRALNFKNPDQLIEQYKKEEGYQIVQSIVDAHNPSDAKFGFSFADFKVYQLYTVFVVALLILLWFTIANYSKNNIDLNLLKPSSSNAKQATNGMDLGIDLSGNSVVADQPQRTVTAGSGTKVLDVQIANNAWYQIIGVAQKKILFEGDVGPSHNFDHFKFLDDQGFVLSTGDAGAFIIDAGNGPFKLGKTGETIKWYYPQTARTIYKSWDENTTVEKAELPANGQANDEISNNDVMAINQAAGTTTEAEVKTEVKTTETPSTYSPQEQQLIENPLVKRSAVAVPTSELVASNEAAVQAPPPIVKKALVQPTVTRSVSTTKKVETKKSSDKKDKKKKKKKDKKKSED